MTEENHPRSKLVSTGGNIWVAAWLVIGIAVAVVATIVGPTSGYFHGSSAWTRGPEAAAAAFPLFALVVLVPSTLAAVRCARFYRDRSAGAATDTATHVRPSLFVVRLVLAIGMGVAIAFAARAFVTPVAGINNLEFVAICCLAAGVPIVGAIYLGVKSRPSRKGTESVAAQP